MKNMKLSLILATPMVTLSIACGSSGPAPGPDEGQGPLAARHSGEETDASAQADTNCPPCQSLPPSKCTCGIATPGNQKGPGCSTYPYIYKITFITGSGAGAWSTPLGLYMNGNGNACAGDYVPVRVIANSNRASTASYSTIGYDSAGQLYYYGNASGTDSLSDTWEFWPVNLGSPNPLAQIGITRVQAAAGGGVNSNFVKSISGNQPFSSDFDSAFVLGWGGVINYTAGSYAWISSTNVSQPPYTLHEYEANVQTPVGNTFGAWVDVLAWSNGPHPCIPGGQPTGQCPTLTPEPYQEVGSFMNYPSSAFLTSGPTGICGFHDFVGPENATGDHNTNGLYVGPSAGNQYVSSLGGVSGTGWCLGI